MSNITQITFDDTNGKGTLTMYKNPFENGRKYYARFDRDTITMNQIIARIQKKNLGTNALMVKHIIGLIKAEILEALSKGESINIFDLGVLFITADAAAENDDASDLVVTSLSAGFTPSPLTNDALKDISVKKITVADNSPVIQHLVDTYAEAESTEFLVGTQVRVTGTHLKLGGETYGVFLCPVDGEGTVADDEGAWTKITDNLLKINVSNRIEFIVPREQAAGDYKILLRTSYAGGTKSLKTVRDVLSDVIRVTKS